MFYLFNHMPKCGGTSFGAFLEDVFDVVRDYIGANHKARPDRLHKHVQSPVALSDLTERNCLVGHYNLKDTLLWRRYPALETLDHKKFSVLRDPFETAVSGVHFGIRRGRLPSDLERDEIARKVMGRSRYFSRVLGIADRSEIDAVLDRYWFVAPLERIDEAALLIERETGHKGRRIARLNSAETDQKGPFAELEAEFHAAAALDYEICRRAADRFDRLTATAA